MSDIVYEHIKHVSIFKELNKDDVSVIEKFMFFNRVAPNEYVFREGETGDFVCFVMIGRLEVIKNTPNGEANIHTLTSGDSIGEMALIDNLTRSASVRASEHSGFMVLTRKGFEQIQKAHPEIGIKMLKGLSRSLSINLRNTSEKLAQFMPQL